ncbi:hypothetical protein [Azospirillum sp.]|uniref:hypothetical protein n=1 Tax=Azospirillum sp. TaxID=34012 RepID=UPI003D72BA6C
MGSNITQVRQQFIQLKRDLTDPAAFVKMHAETAKKAIADLEAKQGAYPKQTIVDGRRGAAEEQVKPGGVIEYHINPVAEAIDAIYEELVKRSPVGPAKGGHYRDDHQMFVNGIPFNAEEAGRKIEVFPSGTEVVFINTRPYARKIEGGFRLIGSFGRTADDRTPGLSVQAPNGVYEVTAREMKRRFANYPMEITFEYRAVMNESFNVAKGERVRGAKGRFVGWNGGATRYRFPCIAIKVL